jgi:putative acyl-CoA dehydrogenase
MSAATHEVFNQPEPLVDVNLFETNRPLQDALRFNAPQADTQALARLGALAGSAPMQVHARLANTHAPELHTHDRFGRRIDEVEFHPSYHVLMAAAVEAGLHGTPWASPLPAPLGEGGGGGARAAADAHILRAAGFMLFTELEPSVLCPISMTYAVTPALRGSTCRRRSRRAICARSR